MGLRAGEMFGELQSIVCSSAQSAALFAICACRMRLQTQDRGAGSHRRCCADGDAESRETYFSHLQDVFTNAHKIVVLAPTGDAVLKDTWLKAIRQDGHFNGAGVGCGNFSFV